MIVTISYQNLRLRTNMSLGMIALVIQLRFNKFTASNRYTTYAKVRAIRVVKLPESRAHLPLKK